jgi:hypothetical protein
LYFKLSVKNYYNLSQTETKVTGKERKQWIMNYTKKVDWKLERETKLKLRRDLRTVAGALKLYSDKDKLKWLQVTPCTESKPSFFLGVYVWKIGNGRFYDILQLYHISITSLQLQVKCLFFFFSFSILFQLHPFITNLMSYKLKL